MAQLRQDFNKFVDKNAEILVVGPDDLSAFQKYWDQNKLPFTGLPDPEHKVADLYGQQVKFTRLGRMPAMMLIDQDGHIRFHHYADSMRDIPPNQTILEMLDILNQEKIDIPDQKILDNSAVINNQ